MYEQSRQMNNALHPGASSFSSKQDREAKSPRNSSDKEQAERAQALREQISSMRLARDKSLHSADEAVDSSDDSSERDSPKRREKPGGRKSASFDLPASSQETELENDRSQQRQRQIEDESDDYRNLPLEDIFSREKMSALLTVIQAEGPSQESLSPRASLSGPMLAKAQLEKLGEWTLSQKMFQSTIDSMGNDNGSIETSPKGSASSRKNSPRPPCQVDVLPNRIFTPPAMEVKTSFPTHSQEEREPRPGHG